MSTINLPRKYTLILIFLFLFFWVGFLLWFVKVCVFHAFLLEPPGLKNPKKVDELVVESTLNNMHKSNWIIPPVFGVKIPNKNLETTN